jgi:hypothetical protein
MLPGSGLLSAPFFQHARPHAGGADGVDSNAERGVVECHAFGERDECALRRSISGVIRLADKPHHAGGIQDGTAGLPQRRQSGPGGPEGTLEIDLENAIPFFFSCLSEGLGWRGDASVIVTASRQPKRFERGLDGTLDGDAVGDIASDCGAVGTQLVRGGFGFGLVDVGNHNRGAFSRTSEGAFTTNARGGACDEDDFTF